MWPYSWFLRSVAGWFSAPPPRLWKPVYVAVPPVSSKKDTSCYRKQQSLSPAGKENQFKALWNICACAAPGIKLIVHCVWQTVYHATELVNTEEPILKTDEINWYFHADTIGWKGEFITCINLLSTSYRLILYPFGAEHPIIPLHIVAILSQFMFYSKSWQDFKDYR